VDRRPHRVAQPVEDLLELVAQGLLAAPGGAQAGQGGAGDVDALGDLLSA
jgi:hypothetical protein